MTSKVPGEGARLKMITTSVGRLNMPSPNTLAKLEDPRAWHARGEVGIQQPKRPGAAEGALGLPMAPPLPKGRPVPVKKTVLEEEEYVERLGEIIEGDYFPHNAKMYRAIRGLSRRGGASAHTPGGSIANTPSSVSELPTPGGPGGSEERGDSESRAGGKSSTKEAGTGGALTKFVATHTSEDNQAFAELQEKDQEAFRRRYFWAYDTTPEGEGNNATSSKLLILPDGKIMSVERREQMDAACADRPKIGDDRPNQVETWKHRTRNQLMFSPNIAASNDICRIEQEPTAAPLLLKNGASKSSTSASRRRLLEQPSQDVGPVTRTTPSKTSSAEGGSSGAVEGGGDGPTVSADTADSLVSPRLEAAAVSTGRVRKGKEAAQPAAEDEPSRAPPSPGSDVVDGDSWSSRSPLKRPRPPSPPAPTPRSAVVVKTNPKVIQAHATRFPVPAPRRPRQGPWASPIEKPSSSRESVAELLAGTRDAPDYEEVPMTPSRVPGVDGDSPQITWGSIDGTPMILDPRATPIPHAGGDGTLDMDMTDLIGALGGVGRGGQQFEVKELPARDKLAHRLEAVDTRRKRAKLGPGTVADGRGTHTPAVATPLTPQTPGTARKRTPGTGRRTPARAGKRTPAKGKAAAMPSTPAARTLAAKLAQRQSADTPFGGGLTPGRQKRRSNRSGKSGGSRDGLTPLPSTPARSATPVAANGQLDKRSSLTDGLLALK